MANKEYVITSFKRIVNPENGETYVSLEDVCNDPGSRFKDKLEARARAQELHNRLRRPFEVIRFRDVKRRG